VYPFLVILAPKPTPFAGGKNSSCDDCCRRRPGNRKKSTKKTLSGGRRGRRKCPSEEEGEYQRVKKTPHFPPFVRLAHSQAGPRPHLAAWREDGLGRSGRGSLPICMHDRTLPRRLDSTRPPTHLLLLSCIKCKAPHNANKVLSAANWSNILRLRRGGKTNFC